jgi:hypothetical protein
MVGHGGCISGLRLQDEITADSRFGNDRKKSKGKGKGKGKGKCKGKGKSKSKGKSRGKCKGKCNDWGGFCGFPP